MVETQGSAPVSYLRSIPGRKQLCLEEGTHSARLYEILSPHVEEIVIAGINESRGQKNDELDAFRRAGELRTGTIKTFVFKAPRRHRLYFAQVPPGKRLLWGHRDRRESDGHGGAEGRRAGGEGSTAQLIVSPASPPRWHDWSRMIRTRPGGWWI